MNCPECRAALAEFVYADAALETRTAVQSHLDNCPDCRREEAALRQVRRMLSASPAPEVRVDTAAIYRQAAERQTRCVRRWRRVAVAALAAAVLVAVGVGLSRLEVHVTASELVLCWGAPAAVPVAPPQHQGSDAPRAPVVAPPVAPDPAELASIEDRLHTLGELTQALADDAHDRDEQRGQEIARLREQLRSWQGLSAERLSAMQQDFNALYVAQFPSRKGVNP